MKAAIIILAINILFVSSQVNFLQEPKLELTFSPTDGADLLQGFLSGLLEVEVCKITDTTLIDEVTAIYETVRTIKQVFDVPRVLISLVPKVIELAGNAKNFIGTCSGDATKMKVDLDILIAKLKDPQIVSKVINHASMNMMDIVGQTMDLISGFKTRSFNESGRKLGKLIRFTLSW